MRVSLAHPRTQKAGVRAVVFHVKQFLSSRNARRAGLDDGADITPELV
jgi:hypothetical protein